MRTYAVYVAIVMLIGGWLMFDITQRQSCAGRGGVWLSREGQCIAGTRIQLP